jgi:hypothetical protein
MRDQDIPTERRLSASTVSLNVFELLGSQRASGIGRNPRTMPLAFPRERAPLHFRRLWQGTLRHS